MIDRWQTWMVGIFLAGLIPILQAQEPIREGFESPRATWTDEGGDVQYRLRSSRVTERPHSGKHCEYFHLQASHGSALFVSHPVPQARVIEELSLSLWVRANRNELQMSVRAVLPYTVDPETQQPLRVMLRGPLYDGHGRWEQLTLRNPAELLRRRIPVLQSQLGNEQKVDTRLAYVDRVFLNIYGGHGTTHVWVDDLELKGFVARSQQDEPFYFAASKQEEVVPARARFSLEGGTLRVDGEPVFIRAIQYQGEALLALKELGFNAIWMEKDPPAALLHEAVAARLWVICPPPRNLREHQGPRPPQPVSTLYDRVVVWNLGQGQSPEDLTRVRVQTVTLKTADQQLARPTLCLPTERLDLFSRQTQIAVVGHRVPMTSTSYQEYVSWLKQRRRLLRPSTLMWARVPTEVSPHLIDQWQSLTQVSAEANQLPHEQFRLQTWSSVLGGARGLLFESHSPLDEQDATTLARAKSLEVLNLELSLIEDWLAGGRTIATLQSSNHAEVQAVVLSSGHTKLVLAAWTGAESQYVPTTSEAQESVRFIVPGLPQSAEVFQVTPTGLRPVETRRVTGGMELTLDHFLLDGMLLVTPDPGVLRALRQRVARARRRSAQLHKELAESKFTQVSRWLQELGSLPESVGAVSQSLTAARNHLGRCQRGFILEDYGSSWQAAQDAWRPLLETERLVWQEAVALLESPQSTPFASNPRTLLPHVNFLSELRSSRLGPNLLLGGNCEHFETLIRNGWMQHQSSDHQTDAWLAAGNPHSGNGCLQLSVKSSRSVAFESPPLRISTGSMTFVPGARVRISGWLRWTQAPSEPHAGVRVYDSIGGEDLALSVQPGEKWQMFSYYRVITEAKPLQIEIALLGAGQLAVDDVSVQQIFSPATPDPGQSLPTPNRGTLPVPADRLPPPTGEELPAPRPSGPRLPE